MKLFPRTLALAALALASLAAAPSPYSEALSCAAVTQAGARLKPDDAEVRDAAAHWAQVLTDAAKAEAIPTAQSEADQSARRDDNLAKLQSHDPRTHALLGICTMRAKDA
jgi:hypothetical protein